MSATTFSRTTRTCFRLNIKVRDPELTELNRSLDARYEQVATVCKRAILLLKGEERKAPKDVCKG